MATVSWGTRPLPALTASPAPLSSLGCQQASSAVSAPPWAWSPPVETALGPGLRHQVNPWPCVMGPLGCPPMGGAGGQTGPLGASHTETLDSSREGACLGAGLPPTWQSGRLRAAPRRMGPPRAWPGVQTAADSPSSSLACGRAPAQMRTPALLHCKSLPRWGWVGHWAELGGVRGSCLVLLSPGRAAGTT